MTRIVEGDQNLSAAREAWAERRARRGSTDLVARDGEVFFHQVLSTPCLDEIVSARGPWLELANGKLVLDFHGNSVHQVGFGHPAVIAAITETARRLPFSTRRFVNAPAVRLAERLIELAPPGLRNDARVLFAPSGSLAIGIALKIARAVTGRHKTVSFYDAFHGASIDAASVSGQDLFRRGLGPMLPGTIHVPPPGDPACNAGCAGRCDASCARHIETVLEREGDIAAVIAEPVRATTVHRTHPDFWPRVRAACDRTGTLLIFDEIPTGLGRSGHWWVSELVGVCPDLLVVGKGLGGAMFPHAAVIGRASLNDGGATPIRELALGHYTHEKSPLGAAAGLATIDIIEREGLVARAAEIGAAWGEETRRALAGRREVREVRQIGMMLAIELDGPDAPALADCVMYRALARGLSFKVGGGTSLVLGPPLNIDRGLLTRATGIVVESLDAALALRP
jgi:4-aminobutyrate aminotransferase